MNFNNHYNKVTVLIVTFKSHNIIEKCLDNLDENYSKKIIENSGDIKFTSYLKKKYKNLDSTLILDMTSGFGFALNRGFEKVKLHI